MGQTNFLSGCIRGTLVASLTVRVNLTVPNPKDVPEDVPVDEVFERSQDQEIESQFN